MGQEVGVYGVDHPDLLDALTLEGDADAHLGESPLYELAHRVLLAGGDDVVVGLVLLQHQVHGAHVVAGVAPVAQ